MTTNMLRFYFSMLLELERKVSFLDGHKLYSHFKFLEFDHT